MKHAIKTAGVSGHWPVFMGAVVDARNKMGLQSPYENKYKLTVWKDTSSWHLALLANAPVDARVRELFEP